MTEDFRITTLAQRPELRREVEALKEFWPEFMMHEPIAERFYLEAPTEFADYILVCVSASEPDKVLARAYSVPIGLADDPVRGLPEGGWDWAVRQAYLTRLAGYQGDALCGLEVTIRPELRGARLGSQMLHGLHALAEARHLPHFVAPVRPPGKADFPHLPMSTYIQNDPESGLPEDMLLRANVKLGAEIIGVAPVSMVVTGTLDEWQRWTGVPFDKGGPVVVPDALVPVMSDLCHGVAAYIEPNVWVHRRL